MILLGYAWGLFWLAVAISLFPGFAKCEEKEIRGKFLITGYNSGEFAVKGPIEDQVMKATKEIKEKIGDRTGRLQVVLIGSADTTGTGPTNDKLARDRAVEVAATLAPNFPPEPETKIISRSRGDAENKKQVRGEWSFTPKQKESWTKVILWGVILGLLIIVVLLFCFFGARRSKKSMQQTAEITNRWVEMLDAGKKYSVPIEVRDGKFFSPFKTLEDPTKPLFRSNFQDVKKAVKGCMADVRYAAQKAELIRRGVIKVSS